MNVDKENEKFAIKALLQWKQNTTIHGIPKIFNNQLPKSIRLLWLILCVLAIFTGIAFIAYLTKQYFQYNVTTSADVFRNQTTDFPVVTICNYNVFNTPHGKTYLKNIEKEFNKLETFKTISEDFSKIKTKLRIKHAKSILYKNKTLYNNISAIRYFGSTLESMMLSCFFGTQRCSPKDFEYFFDINHGNCYRYNSGLNSLNESVSIKRLITSGDSSGLQLDLYLGQENKNDRITYSSGIYLAIHNKSFRGLLTNNGFTVPTSRETKIGIKRKFSVKLDPPYNECIKKITDPTAYDSDLFKRTIYMAGIYSKKYCYKLCIQKYLNQNCGCFDIEYPILNSIINSSLDYENFYDCSNNYIMNTGENIVFKEECAKECPSECDRIDFDYTISGNEFPSINYGYELLNELNFTKTDPNSSDYCMIDYLMLQKSVLRINVFYQDLNYDFNMESPEITFPILLLNIGYTFGLCFGMSLLSACELIEILTYFFDSFLERLKKKREKNKVKIDCTIITDTNEKREN